MKIQNPNKKIIKVFIKIYIFLVLIGFVMMPIPGLSEYYFFPHIFGGGIFLAIIILFFSGKRLIPQMESLVKGERLLAKWQLDLNETRKFADAELKRRKSDLYSTAFALIIGALLLYATQIREISFTGSLMLGGALAVFSYVMGTLYLKMVYSDLYHSEAEIIIGYDGLLFNDEYHMWNKWGRSLENISFDEKEMLILFEYISRGSKGARNKRVVRIPVPQKNKIDAEKIVELFKKERGIEI